MTEYLIHVWRWRGDRTLHAMIYGPAGSLMLHRSSLRRFGINSVGVYALWVAPATLVGDYAEPLLLIKPSRKRWTTLRLQFLPDQAFCWLSSWGQHWMGAEPGLYSYRLARLHRGWVRSHNDRETS